MHHDHFSWKDLSVEEIEMRATFFTFLAALLIAAMPLPAQSKAAPVKGTVQGTATVGKGIVRGAGRPDSESPEVLLRLRGQLAAAFAASPRSAIAAKSMELASSAGIEIDYFGELLIGCISCSKWGRPGGRHRVMEL